MQENTGPAGEATPAPVGGSAVDFDHHDPSMSPAQRWTQYEQMRSTCPVAHVERYGGFDVVSGYPEVKEAAATRDDISSAGDGIFIPPSGLPPLAALEFDGDEHRAWRKLFDSLLNPAAVRAMEPDVLEIVDFHIDAFADRGEVDLVPAFTHPVPGAVVGRLFGLSVEESVQNQQLADAFFHSFNTAAFEPALQAFTEFNLAHLHARRDHPRDDFLSQLASGSYQGMDIDDEVAFQILITLLGGGHHSTASGLAGLVRHVLINDEVRTRLKHEPKLIGRIIEESLRMTTPLQLFARTAKADTTVSGCPIPKGDRLLLNYAAANRDPDEFPDPYTFSLERTRNRHLSFGTGEHVCQGQPLARLELRVGLTRLLERLPDLTLTDETDTTAFVSGQLMTLQSLPARFTPTR